MTRPEKRGGSFTAADRFALIAGRGRLPVEVAAGLSAVGISPFVILVEGEGVERAELEQFDHVEMALEQFGELVPLLKRRQISHLVMAGGISRRPRLRKLKRKLSLLPMLPALMRALARGDNTLLRVLVGHFERSGLKVVGVHEIVPNLLARAGAMTKTRPTSADERDIAAAREAAIAIGRLDIGQAAVAVGGRAIALEGIEGTDGLLQRVRDLRSDGRIAAIRRGVLAKFSKPGQELRADLPSIGPMTIEAAHAAGLAGIAIEAERSFVLEYGRTIERADALGLFVVGVGEVER